MTSEIWKPIVVSGIEYEYLVSNKGRIRSLKNGGDQLFKLVIQKDKYGKDGYVAISIRSPDKSKYYTTRVHRVVAIAFLENTMGYKEVNHIDGNKNNNNVENLEWCSRQRNIIHSFEHGLNCAKKGIHSHLYDKGRKVSVKGVIYESVASASRGVMIPRTSLSGELRGDRENKSGIKYI